MQPLLNSLGGCIYWLLLRNRCDQAIPVCALTVRRLQAADWHSCDADHEIGSFGDRDFQEISGTVRLQTNMVTVKREKQGKEPALLIALSPTKAIQGL